MDTANTLLAIGLLNSLLERALSISSVIQSARNEGRDITVEELETCRNDAKAELDKLKDSIDSLS